jgi:heptosyltransferase-1
LQDNSDLDEALIWPRKRWSELWKKRAYGQLRLEVRDFSRLLKARQFDLCVDLQGLLKSGWLSYLSGARYRVGLGSREGSQFFMHRVLDRSAAEAPSIGSEYRSALEQLGLAADEFRMKIGVSASSQQSVEAKLTEAGLTGVDLIFCPFTTRPQKHWRDTHWLALGQQLADKGRQMLVLGGPGDRAAGEQLAAIEGVISFAGQTTLPEAAALISRSRGVIGVDTGLTHMGHAFRVPTLCLFGSTRPYLDPDNPRGKVIYLDKPCAPCRRHPTCGGSFHCMGDITPATVEQEFLALEGRIL